MTFPGSLLNGLATYWAPSTEDKYGKQTFVFPVTIGCHWEDRVEVFKNRAGEDLNSQAVVYLDDEVEELGYLYHGTSTATNPTTVSGAYQIKGVRRIPTIDEESAEIRAFL